MPRKTKKFIDKKNSVTFGLVHRSQADPLITDENAPQRVLIPLDESKRSKHEKDEDKQSKESRKEEQQKYGIFFDDDYNYLKHLSKRGNDGTLALEMIECPNQQKNKSSRNKPKIQLPASVFESEVQEKVGLLNRPAISNRMNLDPELMEADAALSEDGFEDELEDNFVELCGGAVEEEFIDNDEFGNEYDEDGENENIYDEMEFGSDFDQNEARDEVVSMTTSVANRLEDKKFEVIMETYDDENIGSLEMENIEGHIDINSDLLLQLAKEEEEKSKEDIQNVTELFKNQVKMVSYDSNSEDELEKIVCEDEKRDKWDCESILTTYTNIYNRPKLIMEPKSLPKIKINRKTGIPENESIKEKEDEDDECNSLDNSDVTDHTNINISKRSKNETAEEKRERKQLVKALKRQRRQQKKMTQEMFKEEKKTQEKLLIGQNRAVRETRIC